MKEKEGSGREMRVFVSQCWCRGSGNQHLHTHTHTHTHMYTCHLPCSSQWWLHAEVHTPPEMEQDVYAVEMPLNTPVGTVLTRVTATTTAEGQEVCGGVVSLLCVCMYVCVCVCVCVKSNGRVCGLEEQLSCGCDVFQKI